MSGKEGPEIHPSIQATRKPSLGLLVPPGQEEAYTWVTEEREVLPGFKIITRTRKLVNAEDYLRSRGYDINVPLSSKYAGKPLVIHHG